MGNTVIVNRISPTAFIRQPAADADCKTQSTEGINMKKLFGIAALLLALTPFAQAQNMGDPLAGHPDARNDRQVETAKPEAAKHHGKAVKHHAKVEKKAEEKK
ncbi:hypothetical protein [Collimonas sp.]|jgi:hypothetical protein|uniref:hypothetical protein n=1 Tax=Collimonas sp. TaxID=1963772 RepID=UPI002BCF7D11|nr:hypothetical protein [Collimonas sp.]HWW07114.1 hypothetical protein [Collimonas sp.]